MILLFGPTLKTDIIVIDEFFLTATIRQGQIGTDRKRQGQTEKDRERQGQTEKDRVRQGR